MAQRYAYLAFDYLDERYTEPMTLREFNLQMSSIYKTSDALLQSLSVLRGPAVEALNNSLPSSAANTFEPKTPTLGEFKVFLERLFDGASHARAPEVIKDSHGRAPEKTVRKIADQAANDFFEITDKKPSRSNRRGEFNEFLETLFAALRIDKKSSSLCCLCRRPSKNGIRSITQMEPCGSPNRRQRLTPSAGRTPRANWARLRHLRRREGRMGHDDRNNWEERE